jgi:hypothetical protein
VWLIRVGIRFVSLAAVSALLVHTGVASAADPVVRIELPSDTPAGAYECRPVVRPTWGTDLTPVPAEAPPPMPPPVCAEPPAVPPPPPLPPPPPPPPSVAADALADFRKSVGHVELIARASMALVEPQSPVRFAPGPGSAFATEPGGLYDGSDAPYRGGVQIAAGSGYRATQSFSFGLGGSFTKLVSASVFQDGTKDLARLAFSIAPYVRGYLPLSKHLELWGSFGMGFKVDTQSFNRPTRAGGMTAAGKWTMTHEGFAMNLGFGLDFKIGDSFYVGPSAQYGGVIATGGCLDIDSSNLKKKWCTSDKVSVTRAFSYQQLSLGLSARLAL